jgi:hypothetical protein
MKQCLDFTDIIGPIATPGQATAVAVRGITAALSNSRSTACSDIVGAATARA